MRVRLLRNIRMNGALSVELLAGTVCNIMPDVAEKWIKQGAAMFDKSTDGGSKIKDGENELMDGESKVKSSETVKKVKQRRKHRRTEGR